MTYYINKNEKLIKVVADLQNIYEDIRTNILGDFTQKFSSDYYVILNKLSIVINAFERIMMKQDFTQYILNKL